jgi:hypothetical protein
VRELGDHGVHAAGGEVAERGDGGYDYCL